MHAPEFSHFFRTFTRAAGLFFSGYSRHSQDMYYIWYIYFGYFRHSAAHLFVHILLMLQKFCIFFRTLPEPWGCFFFRYSRHSQDMYYFDLFISDIWDIKHLIYLCMFQKFCTFLGHLPEHQDCFFFQIFWTLPGHVLHLTYLFRIFRTLSTSFICACFRSSASF